MVERRSYGTELNYIKDDVAEIKNTVDEIKRLLNGNGTVGLITRSRMNGSSIKRIWWFMGSLMTSLLFLVCFVLKQNL